MSRVFVIYGLRKLIWTLIIVAGVLIPLLLASYRMPITGVAGQAAGKLTYFSEGEGFFFSYPQDWLLRVEKNYGGSEITETDAFVSSDGLAHGYFQVIRTSESIAEFIDQTKKDLTPGYDSFSLKEKSVGDKDGYVLSYKRGRGDARRVVTEFYFAKSDRVFLFSCFYPEKGAALYTDIFEEMLASFGLQAAPSPSPADN